MPRMKEKCEMAVQKRLSPGGESGVTKRWDRTGMVVVALTRDKGSVTEIGDASTSY